MAKLVKEDKKTYIVKNGVKFRLSVYGRWAYFLKHGKEAEELSDNELDEL